MPPLLWKLEQFWTLERQAEYSSLYLGWTDLFLLPLNHAVKVTTRLSFAGLSQGSRWVHPFNRYFLMAHSGRGTALVSWHRNVLPETPLGTKGSPSALTMLLASSPQLSPCFGTPWAEGSHLTCGDSHPMTGQCGDIEAWSPMSAWHNLKGHPHFRAVPMELSGGPTKVPQLNFSLSLSLL